MDRFLRALLLDLLRRCAFLRDRFAAIPADPDVRDHALAGYQEVETIRREVERRLADPTLSVPSLIPNYLQEYKRWREFVMQIEGYPLVFVERFAESDRRLTRLCRHLATHMGWPLPMPLVVAFSNDYYWTVPPFNVVAAAPTEGQSLLSLPDFCHELGHILLEQHEAMIVGDFILELTMYVAGQRRQARVLQRPGVFLPQLDALFAQWKDRWLREFVSDMVATYLVGPAFGWQHVKLCADYRSSAFYPGFGEFAEHPADEARLRGILAVLDLMSAGDLAIRVDQLWADYISTTGESRPTTYDLCYPQALIESLARRTVSGCRTLGLNGFDQIASGTSSFPSLLIAAWEAFLVDAENYGDWERQRLDDLWRLLGFPV